MALASVTQQEWSIIFQWRIRKFPSNLRTNASKGIRQDRHWIPRIHLEFMYAYNCTCNNFCLHERCFTSARNRQSVTYTLIRLGAFVLRFILHERVPLPGVGHSGNASRLPVRFVFFSEQHNNVWQSTLCITNSATTAEADVNTVLLCVLFS